MILLAAAAAAALAASACLPVPDPDFRAGHLFRHRWWNYYERALEKAEERAYESARADLAKALKQRRQDQRMARTYGMHFIDYFPHRELGVLHWLEGNLSLARAELARSIEQEPSAKARYYLDRVRKALIERRGGEVRPPRLEIETPQASSWITSPTLTVKGKAADENFVSSLRINGEELYLAGAREELVFRREITLAEGRHTLLVEAENLAGRSTEEKRIVYVDSLGPQVVFEKIVTRDAKIRIKGVALDEAGISRVRIDGQEFAGGGSAEVSFTHFVDGRAEALLIRCEDRLGNRSVFRLEPKELRATRNTPLLLAGLHAGPLFRAKRDEHPPTLVLQDWQAEQIVYMDKVVLTGSVRDKGTVSSLTINGEEVLPKRGPLVFFTHVVTLKPGENAITLAARDASGNRSAHTFRIERSLPKALLLEERLRLAVFAFEQKGRISPASFAFQDDFIHALVERRRFQVVERQRLDLILEEQNLSSTDLVDRAAALELGSLAAAHVVVAGSLVETLTGIEIVGRVIESETGTVLCTADVYGENKTLPGLKTYARAMALKLHRQFPLVEGRLIEKEGDQIITDLTLEKLCAQRRLLIYDKRPVFHRESGRQMGMDYHVLGAARVFQAGEHISKARLQDDASVEIDTRHFVITQ